MGNITKIGWTDSTFNPWWGCVKVSPECFRCYALTFSHRLGMDLWGPDSKRRFFGDKHWNEPRKWNEDARKAGVRRRVFCGSMCDWLEDRQDLVPHRKRLIQLINETEWLDWLLLSKRPENLPAMLPSEWIANPRHNVWLGTTAGNQEWFDRRVPVLVSVPAAVRFLSLEPLLGPIDMMYPKTLFPNGPEKCGAA